MKQARKPKRRKFSKLLIFFTLIVQILASLLIALMLVVHGPFDNIRTILIGSLMGTYRHKYFASMLFSQSQIDAVMNTTQSIAADEQDLSQVNPTKYNDSSIKEEMITATDGSYSGYLLEISDPLRVKLAMTKYLGKVGENASDMARENNAVAAINGGGFGDYNWAGTGAEPSDFVFINGEVKAKTVSDDKKCDVIAMNAEGQLIVGKRSINDLLGMDVKVISAVTLDGYPSLISKGKRTFESARETSGWGYASRTAIGQKTDGTVLMLVLDGRRLNMKGASLYDVQQIMYDHGAVVAANLDGGNSSVMYLNGEVINNPSGELGERTVATAFYVES